MILQQQHHYPQQKHTIVNKNKLIKSVCNSKWIGWVIHLFYSFLATSYSEKIGVLFGVPFLLRIQKTIPFHRNFTIPITLAPFHTIFLHKFKILFSESLYSSISRSSKIQWCAFWCILVCLFNSGSKKLSFFVGILPFQSHCAHNTQFFYINSKYYFLKVYIHQLRGHQRFNVPLSKILTSLV